MRRLFAIALVLLWAGPAQAAVPKDFVGTHASNDPSAAEFAQMSEATAVYRTNLYWPAVELLAPGNRDWSRYDAIVGDAARSDIRVVATIYGSPDWAAARPEHPPDVQHLDKFGRFMEAVVDRYGRGGEFWAAHPDLPVLPIRAWEIWNEPNNPTFWLPNPTVGQYRRVLVVAARAIRRADPSAQVLVGGLFPTAYSPQGIAMSRYLSSLYESGAAPYFDALSVHPYGRDPRASLEVVERARRIMDDHGDRRKPLWINEVGWATSGTDSTVTVSEETQATYLRELIGALASERGRLRLAGVFWYSYRDLEEPGWPNRTGLLRADGSPKPSWDALVALTREDWTVVMVEAARGLSDGIAEAAARF